ncbi:sortase domain-bontaining protein [Actinacidiphila glaucinigra]|uniref:sortase domain-containing protein n=1 Tax=Actinacidiphila glaucinigra TaxID=235986 RepID=UPI0037A83910
MPASASPPPSPRASAAPRSSTTDTPATSRTPPSPDKPGDFALAGHRNTHGEPFRRIDRLRPGDTPAVETATRYTYVVRQTIPAPRRRQRHRHRPVPHSTVHPRRHTTGLGHYTNLATCTPELTSTHRRVVRGGLAAAEPR